jgi:hypothetical protein
VRVRILLKASVCNAHPGKLPGLDDIRNFIADAFETSQRHSQQRYTMQPRVRYGGER